VGEEIDAQFRLLLQTASSSVRLQALDRHRALRHAKFTGNLRLQRLEECCTLGILKKLSGSQNAV
jgi:hypothetical protein